MKNRKKSMFGMEKTVITILTLALAVLLGSGVMTASEVQAEESVSGGGY